MTEIGVIEFEKMKKLLVILTTIALLTSCIFEPVEVEELSVEEPQSTVIDENLIIITLDGLRWQEAVNNQVFNTDLLLQKGKFYGNRNLGSKMNVANPTRRTYPGYHEIFTGNTTGIMNNNVVMNPHETVLEYLHREMNLHQNDVQVVGMSGHMRALFREPLSTFPILTPFNITFADESHELLEIDWSDPYLQNLYELESAEQNIQSTISSLSPYLEKYNGEDIMNNSYLAEALLYAIGKEALDKMKPRIQYYQFAMTDMFGHQGNYTNYLKAAHNISIFILDLIEYVETSEYAENTTILVTTDHGRGTTSWTTHGSNVTGSDQTWLYIYSPQRSLYGFADQGQIYNEQIAATIAWILGEEYSPEHQVAEKINTL